MRQDVAVAGLLVFFIGSGAVSAGTNRWTSIGPSYGSGSLANVRTLAVDPAFPRTLYAGTDRGLWKSLDAGATWSVSSVGLPPSEISALAIDPSRTSTLYAATNSGVFQSLDGGDAWSIVYAPQGGVVAALTVAPSPSGNIFAGVLSTGPSPGGRRQGWVSRSNDGGRTWIDGPYEYAVRALAVDPQSVSTVYAGGDGGVSKSLNGGITWSPSNSGLPTLCYPAAMTIDPASPSTLFVGCALGVFQTTDGGSLWTPSLNGLRDTNGSTPGVGALAMARAPFSGTVYAGTSVGVFRSLDRGASWAAASGGPAGVVAALAVDAGSPSAVYAGLYASFDSASGAFKSLDGGSSWATLESLSLSVFVTALAAVPGSPGALLAGSPGGGVFRTLDFGASWTRINSGLTSLDVRAIAVAARPLGTCASACASQATVYVGTAGGSVFKSLDGGDNWTPMSATLRSQNVTRLVIDPTDQAVVFAATPDASVYKTMDGGDSWLSIMNGMTDVHAGDLVMDPADSSVLYASTASQTWKTTDGGAHWTALGFSAGGFAIAPSDSSVLYASRNDGVWKSVDGGLNWSSVSNGLPTDQTELPVTSLSVDPHSSDGVVAGTARGGVFRTTNGGASWQAVNEDFPFNLVGYQTVGALVRDPSFPSKLYAASSGVAWRSFGTPTEACAGSGTSLRLSANRFQVSVSWRTSSGQSGCGQALPITSTTGAFWFFDPTNVELVVKVLDARTVNGKFWVFYGALTNVEYTISVTDTLTGAVKTYFNPQGELASVADTYAF